MSLFTSNQANKNKDTGMDKKIASQKDAFQAYISADRLKNSRSMCMLGAVLFVLFSTIDFFALSSSLSDVLAIRGIVIAGLMLGFVLTYQSYFDKYYDYIMSSIYLVAAVGVVVSIYLALPTDYASNIYLATLLIIIMTIFAWSYFSIRTSALLITTIISSYAFVAIQKEIPVTHMWINIAFLMGATSIGYFSQHIRNNYLLQNFLLQQSLEASVEQKTIEADQNAFIANHDELTGLPNRRHITKLLEAMLETAKNKNKVMALMFLDLNGFKQVNDIYGHAAGDEVLKIVAQRLELATRKGDQISRLGGDEFLIGLLMKEGTLTNLEKMAQKFISLISQDINIDGVKIKIGASIGVSAYPIHGNTIESLIRVADDQMYKAKHGRKEPVIRAHQPSNSVIVFPNAG